MPRQQMFRLGQTLTAVSFIMWLANNFLNSFALSIALIIVGSAALTLVWKGSTK